MRKEPLWLLTKSCLRRFLKRSAPTCRPTAAIWSMRVEQVNASGEAEDLYDEYAPF